MMRSFRSYRFGVLAGLFAALCIVPSAQGAIDKTFMFKVFLEDEEIGQQRFVISSRGSSTRVEIEASFDVKYWFYTAYSYRHTNTEMWNGECLRMIRSQTNDNGKKFFVNGAYVGNRLELETHSGSRFVNGCVQTFAYWDRKILSGKSLLNSQTGEMNKVTVKELGEEVIPVRAEPIPATHYQIVAEKFAIDLWYSSRGDWVALQSTTETNSRLRYVLQ